MTMRSQRKIRRLFAKSRVTVDPKVDERTIRDTQMALDTSEATLKSASYEPKRWSIIMSSKTTKIAVAAAILVAVLGGIHFLGGSPDGTSVAWADVLAQMDAAQTVIFTFDCEGKHEDDLYWVKIAAKLKGPYRRTEGTQGHRHGDGPAHEETHINILDLSGPNQSILLHPDKKIAYYAPDRGNDDTWMTYEGLKKDFRDGTEESLGTVEIDGKEAICFKVSKEDKIITVWADPDTALPLRIERIGDEGIDKMVLSDIAFDVELSDDLFAITAPDDYCVMNMATEEFKVPFELTEAHLVEGLATSAKSLGGTFPTRFKGGRRGEEAREKYLAESRQAAPVEGGGTPMLGTEFIVGLPEGSDYQYVGEDVQLGDATKAVCWYKPQGSATYRVVYGDLSVKDVAPEDLPPIPWQTEER